MLQAVEPSTTLSRRAVLGAALVPVVGVADPAGAAPSLAAIWRDLWAAANAATDDEGIERGILALGAHEDRIADTRPRTRTDLVDLVDALVLMAVARDGTLSRAERRILSGLRNVRSFIARPGA